MKKRLLAMIMTLAMCLSLLPTAAFATVTTETGDTKTSADQIVSGNGNDGDNATQSPGKKVWVSKTIKPINPDTENVFDVTLQVKTKQNITEMPESTDAAIVLVIDCSTSMHRCLTCGDYTAEYRGNHSKNCDYVSRLSVAKQEAKEFLGTLRNNAQAGDHRYISLVSFHNTANVVKGWVDIMDGTNYREVCTAIDGLETDNGTNISGGLDAATTQLTDLPSAMTGIDNCYTVLLTDGKPTSGNTETSNSIVCEAAKQSASDLKEVANLYSIFYAANPKETCYSGGPTVEDLLDDMSNEYYPAGSEEELNTVFNGISHLIMLLTEAWVVTDPMGTNMSFQEVITPKGTNVTFDQNTLTWNLKAATPGVEKIDETESVYTYTLTYRVKLDTLAAGFEADQVYATNGDTYLTYVFYNENNQLVDENSTVIEITENTQPNVINFKVPSVKGYDGDLSFTKVTAAGQPLSGAKFELTTTDKADWKMTAESDNQGNVKFNNIPSGHTYSLIETEAPAGYAEVEPIDVTVAYGTVTSGITENEVVDPESASLTIAKEYGQGNEYIGNDNTYTVEITDEAGEARIVEVAADGDSVEISGLPFGEYTITEIGADKAGYTLNTTYSEKSVTLNAQNPSDSIIVTNTYTEVVIPPASAELTISGTKKVNDVAPDNATFTFQLKDADGEVVDETAAGAGAFSFDELTFNSVGTYTYTVSEVAGDNNKWSYDSKFYTVIVTVTKNESTNSLEATATYTVGDGVAEVSDIIFTNTFTPANGQLTITKVDAANQDTTLAGAVFTLTPNGEGEAITETSGGNGVATFADIPVGTYTLTEATAPVGYSKDPATYDVTVSVDAQGDTITTVKKGNDVVSSDGAITIKNVKREATATISATKVVKQGGNVAAPTSEKFTFTLTEVPAVEMPSAERVATYTETKNVGAGEFTFTPIEYTEPGTYVYTVSETKGSAADWTYDSAVYTVTIKVSVADGKLVAADPVYKVGETSATAITFTNTYTKNQSTGGGGGGIHIPDNPPALNKVDHFAYIVGYPDGNVMPNGNITRAEVATIFFRMLTDESRDEFWSQSSDYSDVTATKWFNNAVCTLSNGGIITGYADGTFKPNGNITRAEFATMAVRFFSASYEGESLFPDIDQHWAKDYINTAAYEGLINGYEDGTFRPNQPITRAEAMAIVNRVLDRHPDKANLLEDMIQWPDNMDTEKWYYADVQEATNSHDYDMEGTEAEPYEVWTEILPVRDWVAFEKEWSDSNSAEGGEVMK